MKIYLCALNPSGDPLDDVTVFVREDDRRDRALGLRLDLRNHSPTGFAWGYGGSGPSQLALAILADVIGDERALDLYQSFKFEIIACQPRDAGFTLTEAQIRAWVETQPPSASERI